MKTKLTFFLALAFLAINSYSFAQPVANITGTDVLCNSDCDGSADLTVAGGTLPYSYLWSGGETTEDLTNLCAGIYCVTVTDDNSLTATACDTITEPATPLLANITGTNVTCTGGNDGAADLTVTGGTPGYFYVWATGHTSEDLSNIPSGMYCVTVVDANSCAATACVTITEPPVLTATITSSIDISCNGACDGSATVTLTGGAAPYMYSWSDGQTGSPVTNLCAATYCVTVTDANLCFATACVTITEPPPLTSSGITTDETSPGACDGTIDLIPSGGTGLYTFVWSNLETTEDLSGLCVGNYTVTITDANGCTAANSFFINDSLCTLTASITASTDVTCNGDCDGSATVTASGGTSPYTYLWSNADTTQTATNLCAGVYLVSVTDSASCIATSSVTITEPPVLTCAITSSTDVTCNGVCDGTATVTLSGGTPPYLYLWPSSETTATETNLCAGTYCVTVTDNNLCTATACVTITEPATPLSVNIACTAPSDSISCDGSATVMTTGGITPYTYEWSNAEVTQFITNLCQGIYSVTVTDFNGCTASESVLLNDFCGQPGNISGKIFNDLNADCTQDTGEFPISNWLIKAEPGTYYGYTDVNGYYKIYVDTGTYTVSLLLQNSLWQQNCPVAPNYYIVNITSYGDTVSNINFGAIPDVYCPILSVNIATFSIRPCFTSNYSVSYCNNGTIEATNATIEVELDDNMTYSGTTGNLISQIGNILIFDADTVIPGQCGNFHFYVNVLCDMSLVGQTMCVEAHIYPDTLCFPADSTWDKSSVAVEGSCVGDSSACFTIYNTGDPGTGDMDGPSEYRIYENNILVSTGTFQIAGGDSSVICWAANGNTIRLEADQRPGHPGNSHPQDNIEMCGDSLFVTGQITVIPEDDEDDFVEIDCHVAIGSYDPNDKQVKPEGLTETYHYIDSTDVMEYIIHFQNTGTATAINVVIMDTLSEYLDITTIEAGSSSHPYTLDIFGNNILQWTFSNIMLPDSNVNEPASNGFLKYKIHQKVGNTIGTLIENNAGIIFDFNEPIITNMVFNTIGNIDSITANMPIIYDDKFSIKVYPNPFSSTATFEIKGMNEPVTFELYNIIGKQVRAISNINKEKFVLSREDLPAGIYIYKISANDKLICAGKLVVN